MENVTVHHETVKVVEISDPPFVIREEVKDENP